jgi:hypothetical protein
VKVLRAHALHSPVEQRGDVVLIHLLGSRVIKELLMHLETRSFGLCMRLSQQGGSYFKTALSCLFLTHQGACIRKASLPDCACSHGFALLPPIPAPPPPHPTNTHPHLQACPANKLIRASRGLPVICECQQQAHIVLPCLVNEIV